MTSPLLAQTPTTSITGTVDSNTGGALSITTARGSISVNVPSATRVVQIEPGSSSLNNATPVSIDSIDAGDKVLIRYSPANGGTTNDASLVVVMRSAAIQQHQQDELEAWQHGETGLVTSVNIATGVITINSGNRFVRVRTTPTTRFLRYTAFSIRFADATESTINVIQPGDPLFVRGTHTADGTSITADELVSDTHRALVEVQTHPQKAKGSSFWSRVLSIANVVAPLLPQILPQTNTVVALENTTNMVSSFYSDNPMNALNAALQLTFSRTSTSSGLGSQNLAGANACIHSPTYQQEMNACKRSPGLQQSPCYEASRTLCQCYKNAYPTSPDVPSWNSCIASATQMITNLGSNAPTIGH